MINDPVDPLVSVWMITYNHESYIERSIKSVMSQRTTFPFKLFIGIDCSTDRTEEICREQKLKYNNEIELLISDRNIGMRLNAERVFRKCYSSNSTYIATIEGDDFWTDPLKLQKQIDVMSINHDIIMSIHNATEVFSNRSKSIVNGYESGIIEAADVIRKKIRIPTLSMVFRRELVIDEALFRQLKSGDRYLEVAAVSLGKISYLNEVMGIKQTLNTGKLGIWKTDPINSVESKYKSNLLLIKIIPVHLQKHMHWYLMSICFQMLKTSDFKEWKFISYLIKHFILGLRFSLKP